MTRNIRRTLVTSLWLIASLACSDGESVDNVQPTPLVATEFVVIADLEDRVTAVGELVATNHAAMAAEVDGRVTQIIVEEGASITSGQPLLELDPAKRQLELASARARVAESRANVDNMKRQVARQRELFQQRISSQSALDDIETELRLAEAKWKAARADLGVESRALEEATVRAPFDGLVVERLVSLGDYVQIGQPLVEIVSLDPIEVEFRVAEIDSGFVRVGQEVGVHVAPFPDQVFSAKVTVVSPTIDPRSRTLRVKAALDNREGLLRPGLFARADLGLSVKKGIAMVPAEAVLQRVDGSVVFTLDEGLRVQRRLVEIAKFRDDTVAISQGLSAGDRVIVRGHVDLLDGQLVRLANDATQSAAKPTARSSDDAVEAPRS